LQRKYLDFVFFAEVLPPTREAGEKRWAAIRRAADAMGFDPDDKDERVFLLGVLAHILFPARVPRIETRRGPKPDKKRKKLYDHVERLIAAGHQLKSIRGTAKLLKQEFHDQFQSEGAVEKQIHKARRRDRNNSK
jgi:hypothetical protein